MATKKSDSKKKGDKEKDPEKEAKRKARQEALKDRPAEQRPNSKQIDVIAINDKSKVMNFGYAVKNKEGYQGVVVTSVLVTDGKPVSTSVSFVPGTLTVKSKKGHGVICSPKNKKAKEEEQHITAQKVEAEREQLYTAQKAEEERNKREGVIVPATEGKKSPISQINAAAKSQPLKVTLKRTLKTNAIILAIVFILVLFSAFGHIIRNIRL